jgi:serine/threonine protein phosphatase PrpC
MELGIRRVKRITWRGLCHETDVLYRVINAGKSFQRNEDHASFSYDVLHHRDSYQSGSSVPIPVWFFGVFDGHGGDGASFYSARYCHEYFLMNLNSIKHFLAHPDRQIQSEESTYDFNHISLKDLIRGALEATFFDMDNRVELNHLGLTSVGGSTALVSVFVNQTLYIANAGDCRAVIIRDGQIIEMSLDFTPETDRQRIQTIAHMQPHLLGDKFCRFQFERFLDSTNIGDRMLYRDYNMTGWAHKAIEAKDVRRPMIVGQGKTARLLSTISTTRGFGDHDLTSGIGNLLLKPFLTPAPEIRLYDLTDNESLSYDDVLILASDGLWTVLTNEEARDVVLKVFMEQPAEDINRYMTAARSLVQTARGHLTDKGWKTEKNQEASTDDITCFVISLKMAAQEMSCTVPQKEKPAVPHNTDTDIQKVDQRLQTVESQGQS